MPVVECRVSLSTIPLPRGVTAPRVARWQRYVRALPWQTTSTRSTDWVQSYTVYSTGVASTRLGTNLLPVTDVEHGMKTASGIFHLLCGPRCATGTSTAQRSTALRFLCVASPMFPNTGRSRFSSLPSCWGEHSCSLKQRVKRVSVDWQF